MIQRTKKEDKSKNLFYWLKNSQRRNRVMSASQLWQMLNLVDIRYKKKKRNREPISKTEAVLMLEEKNPKASALCNQKISPQNQS
jgi:hypothetical protein